MAISADSSQAQHILTWPVLAEIEPSGTLLDRAESNMAKMMRTLPSRTHCTPFIRNPIDLVLVDSILSEPNQAQLGLTLPSLITKSLFFRYWSKYFDTKHDQPSRGQVNSAQSSQFYSCLAKPNPLQANLNQPSPTKTSPTQPTQPSLAELGPAELSLTHQSPTQHAQV